MLINHEEPVCWANVAASTRVRDAYKWARVDPAWAASQHEDSVRANGWKHRKSREDGGVWRRVRVLSDSGQPLIEKIPQGAQFGTPATGLRNANLRTYVKVMTFTGDEPNVPIVQGAGHDNTADNSYERYMLGTKGKGEGWIPAGGCPVLLAMNGDLQSHKIVSPDVRAAFESAQPCNHNQLGIRNPPCVHYELEQEARMARRQSRHEAQIAAAKSDDAKLLEGQVAVQERTAKALTTAVETMSATVTGLAGAVHEIQLERSAAPKKKGNDQ
jgi:hypothetical protein